jgi:hypothetical protein
LVHRKYYETGSYKKLSSMSIRDWTLQYNMLWASFSEETANCDCPEDYEAYADECRKISTLPTEQPPSFTALKFIQKTYSQYSWYGVRWYDKGYNLDGTGTFELWEDPDNGFFWHNFYNSSSVISGAMNRTAIWANPIYPETTTGQVIGFATCINVPETKTYLVGFGVDNFVTIRVDGIPVMDMPSIEDATTFRYWHVYPVTIKKGIHVLEIIATNRLSIAAIGAEIYNATVDELKACSSDAEVDPYLIFSTKFLRPTFTDGSWVLSYTNLGTNGYPIMVDYALVLCDGNPPYYRKVEYTPCLNE